MSTTLSNAEPSDRRAGTLHSLAPWRAALDAATTVALVAMPLARWHGWTLAETAFGLLAAAGVAMRMSSAHPLGLRARLLDPALFAIWIAAFSMSVFWSEAPRPTFEELAAAEPPPGFMRQLSTCGPLSVLVDEGWYRNVQGVDQTTGLFVVDEVGRSLWLNAGPLPAEWTVEEFADEAASRVDAAEPLRELERRSGSVDGFPAVERLYAVESENELRLLVAFERDGHLIAGWGVSPGLDSRQGIEAVRRVARTARACGDVRDDAPSPYEALPPSLLEALR